MDVGIGGCEREKEEQAGVAPKADAVCWQGVFSRCIVGSIGNLYQIL